jgi:hypothetical protein
MKRDYRVYTHAYKLIAREQGKRPYAVHTLVTPEEALEQGHRPGDWYELPESDGGWYVSLHKAYTSKKGLYYRAHFEIVQRWNLVKAQNEQVPGTANVAREVQGA